MPQVFNPLDVPNVGVTLAIELLRQDVHPVPPKEAFPGAGIYALYYTGPLEIYAPLAEKNQGKIRFPIYIGSAVRKGAKEGFKTKPETNNRVYDRLHHHAQSIDEAENLLKSDFKCRYLVIDDSFILLAESVLIGIFRPVWNGTGFGSKVVGKFRMTGTASKWDILHPGRSGRPRGTQDDINRIHQEVEEKLKHVGSPPKDDAGFVDMFEKITKFI